MSKQLELNWEEGRRLRDEGIETALAHAESQEEDWGEQAYNYLLQYMKENPGKEFMAEDVRVSSFEIVPEPPHNRAWGAIIVKARKAGIIERAGYSPVKNPRAHCSIVSVWKAK